MSQKPPESQRSGVILTAAVAAFVAGVVALVVVLFLASAVTGFADGDPPSDYLLGQQVYLPLNPPSAASGQELKAVVAAANNDGYTIRVAVIQAPQDLGSIPQLLGKPRTYAKFLGAEIAFAYKGRLLTVMSNGFGISQNGGKRVPNGYQQLRAVPAPGGLVTRCTDRCRHRRGAPPRRRQRSPPAPEPARRFDVVRAVVCVEVPHDHRRRRPDSRWGGGRRWRAVVLAPPLGDGFGFHGGGGLGDLIGARQQPVARHPLEPGSGGE